MPEQRLAISYVRFSTPDQGRGDSAGRQTRDFAAFCRRHKLKPAAEHFADHGRSGYKGTHRTKGDLGRFEALVKDKTIPRGAVLVVEAWDRLSRERPDKVIALISSILSAGVDIGVTRLDDIFTEDDLGTHKFTTLSVFVQLAHQESRQKSERIAASWKTRRLRARAEGVAIAGRAPAWVELRAGRFRLIPGRAATVRRIFELSAAGYGLTRIVRALVAEGCEPFGTPRWSKPYVGYILTDRRAVGEYQPTAAGKPEGLPIVGYYPGAVTEQEYLLARVARGARRTYTGAAVRQRKYVNVFAGLLRSAENGEGYTINNSGTAEQPELLLCCLAGMEGRGKYQSVAYAPLERAILSCLREIDPAEVLPRREGPSRLDVLKAELLAAKEQVEQLTADLRRGYSAAISAVLREQEETHKRLKEEVAQEEAKTAHAAEQDWAQVHSLADVLDTAEDPDDVRLRLAAVLRRTISSIWLRIVRVKAVRLIAAQVWFADNKGRRDYLIRYRPAARNRDEQLETVSVPNIATIDLRDPEQAAALAADLAAAELDG